WHFQGLIALQRGQFDEAVSLIQKAVALAPDYAAAHNNLGNVFFLLKRYDEALAAYQSAVQLSPEEPGFYFNIGRVCEATEGDVAAVAAFERVLALSPRHADAHRKLGLQLCRSGRIERAAEVYAAWLKLEPDNECARHLLAGCTGTGVPARASDAYVTEEFDRFAETFDEHLVGRLMYRAPALIGEGLRQTIGAPAADLEALDAGCGTGLCAPELKPYARRLVGVDLSTEMIKRAAGRHLYDELVVGELTGFLAARPRAWDLIASADTLVYFGDLGPVMRAAATALRPGGHLVFTLERAAEAEMGFRIHPHGRYSHTGDYLRAQLAAAGFEPRLINQTNPRTERSVPVDGWLVVARSRTAAVSGGG